VAGGSDGPDCGAGGCGARGWEGQGLSEPGFCESVGLVDDDHVEVVFSFALGAADLDALVVGAGLVAGGYGVEEFVGCFFGGGDVAAVLYDDDVAIIGLEVSGWCWHNHLIFWNS